MSFIARIPSVRILEMSSPNVEENVQTVFDTDRSPLQPDYAKLSIEEFDLYAFTVYAFMDLFWESFNIESNRITKRFRFWFQRNIDDYWIDNYGNGQLPRIELFFTVLNWHFKLYDLKTLQTIDYRIRENNAALDRNDFWNADEKFHSYKGMKDDLKYSIFRLSEKKECYSTFKYDSVVKTLKRLQSKIDHK